MSTGAIIFLIFIACSFFSLIIVSIVQQSNYDVQNKSISNKELVVGLDLL